MPEELIKLAIKGAQKSYAPFSHFNVGAALLTKDNKVFIGCNIENSAYTPTCCAERTAFFKAISEGYKEFKAIAIVGGKDKKFSSYCAPCGVCRQVMMEFCNKDFKIYLGKDTLEYKEYTLEELLPMGFKLEVENENI